MKTVLLQVRSFPKAKRNQFSVWIKKHGKKHGIVTQKDIYEKAGEMLIQNCG